MKFSCLFHCLSKLLLVFLCICLALGFPKNMSQINYERLHRNIVDMSLPHLLLYYAIAVSLFASFARLFGVFKDTLKHLISTALSFISTEILLFSGVYYLDYVDDLPSKYLGDQDESFIFTSLSLRFYPLLLLIIEQVDLKFVSYRMPMLMIWSFYLLYAWAVCVLNDSSGGYIGNLLEDLSVITRILFFVVLIYTTMVLHVYITAINRLNHR